MVFLPISRATIHTLSGLRRCSQVEINSLCVVGVSYTGRNVGFLSVELQTDRTEKIFLRAVLNIFQMFGIPPNVWIFRIPPNTWTQKFEIQPTLFESENLDSNV